MTSNPQLLTMVVTTFTPKTVITWEKLPNDFKLPDDPVDNINQPLLALALSDGLQSNGKLAANSLTCTNYGICATVNGKIVVKAPDWGYVASINTTREEVNRSYTPQLQGEIPTMVMEFLSDTDGSEYSVKPTYPPGKWYFYEKILKVPNYVIFEPNTGTIEVYHLDKSGIYELQHPETNGRYWIADMNLYLGIWEGTKEQRTGYWLRWWEQNGDLLLWSSELAEIAQEQAKTAQERADRLAAQLKAAGIEPEL